MTLPASFWPDERKTLLAILLPRLEHIAYTAMQHAALKMGLSFNPTLANRDAEKWAESYTDTVLDQLGITTEGGVGDILSEWIDTPGATYGDLVNSLMESHLFDQVRASRIATTEITRAYAQGEALAYERELGISTAILPVEDSHIGCRCWLSTKRVGNQMVVVWQTNKDDAVCTQEIETPWGTVAGCQELDGVVVSDGDYLGQTYDELQKMAKSADASDLPPQLNPDPNKIDTSWLDTHDPRLSVFMTGTDPQGNPMIAYLVREYDIQQNLWQDFVEGGNHSRYNWIPPLNYWIASNLEPEGKLVTLVHETSEDRELGGSSTEAEYDEAHENKANPDEFEARHEEDPLVMLAEQGWDVTSIQESIIGADGK